MSDESKSEKVATLGIQRECGYFYSLNSAGDVVRYPQERGRRVKDRPAEVVVERAFQRERGQWVYFIDRDGDIARASAAGCGGRRKKRAAAPVAPRKARPKGPAPASCSAAPELLQVPPGATVIIILPGGGR